ncbi:MAG: phosphatidate cytidylyltransferase, partial [Proteobacteria bacterium]|nr:phosphatidate cytidylyltransferase [Pseudomonadota bacterium]
MKSADRPRPVRLGGPEFRLRLLSALVLAPITLGLVWGGGWLFAGLVALVGSLIVWEWAGLMGRHDIDALTVLGALGVMGAVGLATVERPVLAVAALLLASGATALVAKALRRGEEAAGVLYAGFPALALVWLRAVPGHGFELVLFILFIVWATDTGAYVVGRTIGGPKLWPAVSPNKTWSGFLGGVGLGAIVAVAYAASRGSAAPWHVFPLAAVLAMLSQGGDLFESALKRKCG